MSSRTDGRVIGLMADMLNVPIRYADDILIAEGSHKIALAGMPISVPYSIVSSALFNKTSAGIVLALGGEESSLAVLLLAERQDNGTERGRLFILDTRSLDQPDSIQAFLECERFETWTEVLAHLRDTPEGFVKKNFIWSYGEGHWRAAPPAKKVE